MMKRRMGGTPGGPLLAALLIALAGAVAASAQCIDSSAVQKDSTVRSVKLKALFGFIPSNLRNQLAAHSNEVFSADKVSAYEKEVVDYLSGNPAQQRYEKIIGNQLKLSASARLVTLDCVRQVPAAECPGGPGKQCVDVTLKAYSVDVDVLNSSPYVVALPRSVLVALYDAIPRPLLALNPSLDAVQDPAFGPAFSINTSTNLLDIGKVFKKAKSGGPTAAAPGGVPLASGDDEVTIQTFEPTPRAAIATTGADRDPEGFNNTQLLLGVKGRKSLDKQFYDTSTGLTFARTQTATLFQRLAGDAKFDANNLPQSNGESLRNAVSTGFNADLRLKNGPVQLISLGGRYRWSRNRFTSRDGSVPSEFITENGFEARAAADGIFKKGLGRAIAWFDGGALDRNRGSYSRVAALAGYAKDISISRKKDYKRIIRNLDGHDCYAPYPTDPIKSEPTVGLEVIAGAGRAWGDVPEYARFFGGSQLGSFLYDELSSPDLTSLPSGPVLRSSRLKQAGVPVGSGAQRGGTSYWHVNLNLSFPVASWSYPIIPHEWVTTSVVGENDIEHTKYGVPVGQRVCVDLRLMVKNAVRVSGTELMTAQLARDKLTDRQKKVLRWEGRSDLTADEQAELAAATASYAGYKITVGKEVSALFKEEIFPVTDFIADHANFFDVKPLVLFDAGRVQLPGISNDRTRYGGGGGLQLDIALVRFELGYVFALNRLPGDGRGNFVGRLVIKRFF